MPVGSGVGRGIRSICVTVNPCDSRRLVFCWRRVIARMRVSHPRRASTLEWRPVSRRCCRGRRTRQRIARRASARDARPRASHRGRAPSAARRSRTPRRIRGRTAAAPRPSHARRGRAPCAPPPSPRTCRCRRPTRPPPQSLRQRALAAADIENPLAGRVQQLEHGRAERRDVGRVCPVRLARPAIHAVCNCIRSTVPNCGTLPASSERTSCPPRSGASTPARPWVRRLSPIAPPFACRHPMLDRCTRSATSTTAAGRRQPAHARRTGTLARIHSGRARSRPLHVLRGR